MSRLKWSIQEKLVTLKLLDGEILDLMEEEILVEEIEQANSFKDGIYAAIINIDEHCTPPTVPPKSDPTTHACIQVSPCLTQQSFEAPEVDVTCL